MSAFIKLTTDGKTQIHLAMTNGNKTACGVPYTEKQAADYEGEFLTCRECMMAKRIKMTNPVTPSRIRILETILDCFTRASTTRRDSRGIREKYLAQANILVRVMEAASPGFMEMNDIHGEKPSLFRRFEYLLYRFNLPQDLKNGDRYEALRNEFIGEAEKG